MEKSNQPQYVARLRTGGFTRTGSAEEIFTGLQNLLLADKLYVIAQHPDGKGYELLEVGTLTVDFQPSNAVPQSVEPPPLSKLPLPSSPDTPNSPQDERGEVLGAPPIPNPTRPEDYRFTADTEAPRSQEELAVEKGVDQPAPPKKRGRKAKLPTKKAAETPVKTADTSDQCSDDPNDTSWLKDLPKAVRVTTPGVASVTSVRTATPEEAERASHFGKGF